MIVTLVTLGKIKDKALIRLIEDYCQRIHHYTRFEYIELSAEKRKKTENDTTVKARESDKIMAVLQPQDFVIALDERGTEYGSCEFAQFLEGHQIRGNVKRLVFAIGGATGFSETFLRSANMRIALSKMTLPHQLCRLLLVEQLYRALSIIAGESYHKA